MGRRKRWFSKKGNVFTLVWLVTAVVLMIVMVNGNHL